MEYREKYKRWVSGAVDDFTKSELLTMANDDQLILECFGAKLEFGTAGLRGKMGAGTNRMNIYTVRKATQALSNHILYKGGASRGAAVAFDSRKNSKEFAQEAALVLCANGIRCYLYESMRSVPQLSFTVRKLNCFAGIAITASHNPPEYNGYKVYAEYGGQLGNEDSETIVREMDSIDELSQIKRLDGLNRALDSGYLKLLGRQMDDEYINAVKSLSPDPSIAREWGSSVRIVYTPLYGTGKEPVPRLLGEMGFDDVITVPEQMEQDYQFTYAPMPNPSDPKAMEKGVRLAKESGADLVLGTDPDADRMGCVINTGEDFIHLTGNQAGCLMLYYLLSQRSMKGKLPKGAYIVKSIVSTNMANAIAADFGAETREVLTGFRFIAEEIENSRSGSFQFGFEESAGYMTGDFTRDKDGICACMLMAELAAVCKSKGTSIFELLQSLYKKYGYYLESTTDIKLEGAEGVNRIKNIMAALRSGGFDRIGGFKITAVRDYLSGKRSGSEGISELKAPKSNMLYYELEGGRWACARPSGTEPKLKLYAGARETDMDTAGEALESLKRGFRELIGPALCG
ncbi:MAG: phospho-sugar mutase [Bacillota bacterium]|nr:phospho-sugar mutase [Bacillota bacterium]